MTEGRKEALEPEILEGIKPFSGVQAVETSAEKMISEGKAIQRVQTQYTTAVAVQQPRSIAKITHNVLEEAKLAGAAFYFRWPVKSKKTGKSSIVQGGSIDLGMCIARNYGNCVVDIEGTETPTHFMLKGVFIDLETGFTVPRLFRQRKKQDIGSGYGDDRAEDMIFQIAQSKAQRNAILKAMPTWLIDKAIETAREAEIGKIKGDNLPLARAKVIDFFSPYGITQERIEAKIEIDADHWTAENIADLRANATALKEGRITAEELFPLIKKAETPDPAQELKERMEAGDKQVGGYHDLKVDDPADTQEEGKGPEVIIIPEEEPGGILSDGEDPIEWLTACRPSSSVENAQIALKIFEEQKGNIANLADKKLMARLQNKHLKTMNYISEKTRTPESPAQEDDPPQYDQEHDVPEYDEAIGRLRFLGQMKEYKDRDKTEDKKFYNGILDKLGFASMNDVKNNQKDHEVVLGFMAEEFGKE